MLLDIGLPGINGYDVVRELRRASDTPMTLIAVTGYGQEEDRRRALEAGFDHHITKPVPLDELVRALRVPARPEAEGVSG